LDKKISVRHGHGDLSVLILPKLASKILRAFSLLWTAQKVKAILLSVDFLAFFC